MDNNIKPGNGIDRLADRTIAEVRKKVSSQLTMANFRKDVFQKAKHWDLNGAEFSGSLISLAIVAMKQMGLSNEDIITVVKSSPQFKEEIPGPEIKPETEEPK